MKFNKILLTLAIAGSMLLVACGGAKLDDAAKAEMSKFEGDWMAASESMKAFPNDIKAALDASKASCDSVCDEKTCKKDMKGTCDSLKASCKSVQEGMEAMMKTANEKVAAIEADSKAWADWKAKADKGEVKLEDFKKSMEDWNLKISEMNATMTEWKSKLDELTNTCKSNCESMKGCCEEKK
ncbi:MAG: hypothetical protein HYZ42_08570 [Bacteroidetes bacterium]|nr:hypothetical protein [Bacteroidota bacterium]